LPLVRPSGGGAIVRPEAGAVLGRGDVVPLQTVHPNEALDFCPHPPDGWNMTMAINANSTSAPSAFEHYHADVFQAHSAVATLGAGGGGVPVGSIFGIDLLREG